MSASFGSNEWLTAAAFIVSSLLSLAYLTPVALRALFPPQGSAAPREFVRPGGAPAVTLVAIGATTIGCIALFFLADWVASYLAPIRTVTFMEAAP